jgi:hypothetical protein
LLSRMNPLADLLQCDSLLIRYPWNSRLVWDDFLDSRLLPLRLLLLSPPPTRRPPLLTIP